MLKLMSRDLNRDRNRKLNMKRKHWTLIQYLVLENILDFLEDHKEYENWFEEILVSVSNIFLLVFEG